MIALALALLAQVAPGPDTGLAGDWINQRRTAVVRIGECPSGLCGTIVWSAPAARADAARGGTSELDGTMVMFAFRPVSPQRWRGKLFLPDQGRTVKATLELTPQGSLHVKGCELGGLVCKSQEWTRWAAN